MIRAGIARDRSFDERSGGVHVAYANVEHGTLHERTLQPGEVLRVDTGCIVGFQPSVSYDIQYVGKIKTALFGGEGLFYASLTGPGRVWLQSLPFSRMADRIYKAAPAASGGRREEGSLLGGIGGILDGDN